MNNIKRFTFEQIKEAYDSNNLKPIRYSRVGEFGEASGLAALYYHKLIYNNGGVHLPYIEIRKDGYKDDYVDGFEDGWDDMNEGDSEIYLIGFQDGKEISNRILREHNV